MLKKILRYIGLLVLIIFVYFNYIKQPEQIEKKEEQNMVTTGVSYNVEDYHIKADTQIDDLKNKKRLFKKAIATFNGMKLSGDSAIQENEKNLFLDDNILGIADNGWKLEAVKANYNGETSKITATNQVKAYNEEQGITLYGDSIVTDTKLEDLNINQDIRVLTDKLQLSANSVHYNNTTKIMEIKENIKIRGRKLGSLGTDALSGYFDEATYDGNKKILHAKGDYVVYYKGANLRAKDFVFDENTNNFTISKDVKIEFGNNELDVEKIKYISSENKLYFEGPIKGTYGEYTLEADNGSYDSVEGKLNLDGKVKIYNATKELLADKASYNTKSGKLYMSSKNKVSFEDKMVGEEKILLTKDFTYNNKTKKLTLLNNYDYKQKEYQSKGKELYYDDNTKVGKIVGGTFKSPTQKIDGKADVSNFDLANKKYSFEGNARVIYDNSTLKSNKIDIDDNEKLVNINGSYSIYNPKDKVTFYGQQAKYNMTTGDLTSTGQVKAIQTDKTLTGTNLNYNSNTGLGNLEKNIKLVDKKGDKITGNTANFDSKNYVEVVGNLRVTNKDATLTGNSGKYLFKEETVNIPDTFKVTSKDGHATMRDGTYFIKDKRVEGKDFHGYAQGKEASGDEAVYFIDKKVAQLNKNVVVKDDTARFVGEQAEYSMVTGDIYSPKKYKVFYTTYTIAGTTLKGNMENEIFDGKQISVKSNNGETLYGDFVVGNMKKKQLDLNGHVRALAYNIDKKTKKKEPVKIRGDTVKAFLYNDETGNLTISRSEIKRNGVYEYQDMTLKSDYMEMDMIKKIALARNGAHLNIANKTDIKSEIANMDMNTEVINLINDVKFENTDKEGKKMTGSSDRGTILNKEKTAILKENVVADTDTNHIEADYAEYHIDTGILKAKGNVRLDYK